MIRRPPRSTQSRSSAASDVYKRRCDARADPSRASAPCTSSSPLARSARRSPCAASTSYNARRGQKDGSGGRSILGVVGLGVVGLGVVGLGVVGLGVVGLGVVGLGVVELRVL